MLSGPCVPCFNVCVCRAVRWVWKPWWRCWKPLRRLRRVWSACRGIRPCVCRSWSVWTWWVTHWTCRDPWPSVCLSSGQWPIQRIQMQLCVFVCVFLDERGSESHEWKEIWRGYSVTWKVSFAHSFCLLLIWMNLWSDSSIITSSQELWEQLEHVQAVSSSETGSVEGAKLHVFVFNHNMLQHEVKNTLNNCLLHYPEEFCF